MGRFGEVSERLRSSLWFIPALFAAGAFVLAAVTLIIDRDVGVQRQAVFLFGGTAEGARSVLQTISQSMLTFTALVFTITMLVLQLASSQLSPRVMRTFLRDRGSQVVLGLFIATFLYTLLVLRDVRSSDAAAEFVPGLSIFVAFLLLIASVGAFVYYIDHMAHAIRAIAVIDNIAAETREAIDRLFPDEVDMGARDEPEIRSGNELTKQAEWDAIVTAKRLGNVLSVDVDAIVKALHGSDCFAELVPMVGDFVPEDAPLYRLRGTPDDGLADHLTSLVVLGSERTLQQDAAYGVRQIVDIGLRALSPGINDPTTAVQAIDRLHDLLRRLAVRSYGSVVYLDESGEPRLIVPRPDWSDYVRLAVDELRLSGTGQLQVMRRLRSMLQDLAMAAPSDRLSVLREEATQVERAIDSGLDSQRDRRYARRTAGGTD